MLRNYRPALLLFAVVVVLSPVSAFARKKTKGVDDDKIVSVDVAANKIVVTEGKDDAPVTYIVTKFTAITINGSPAKLADLKKGMKVDVSVSSATTASKIEAQAKTSSKKKNTN